MYEAFFHFSERPFAATPQIEQYYPARAIESARRTMMRCVDRAEGVGVLIGPSGTGKTLVCQLLRHQFHDAFEVVLLGNARIDTPRALLQALLFELGLPCRNLPDGDMRLSLVDHLTHGHTGRAGLLLIADEAHTLPARVLEEIRLITNVTVSGEPAVRLMLAGGPLLEEHLSSPKMESFSQRTAARCYLEPLDRGETIGYIQAQIAAVGADSRELFADSAFESVYRATDGIPRLINQLCDHALVLAFANGVHRLGEKELETAWADLQQLPTPWTSTSPPGHADKVIEFGQLDDEPADEESPHRGLRLAPMADEVDSEMDADMVAAIDEPMGGTEDLFATDETPEERLENIEAQLASLEVASESPVTMSMSIAQTNDPFGEVFAEEEVIVDRFPSMHSAVWDQMPHVYSSEGRVLAELLQTFVHTAKPVETVAAPAAWNTPESEAEQLIIVEDDPIMAQATRPVERAYRQEYSQLFAKLKRG